MKVTSFGRQLSCVQIPKTLLVNSIVYMTYDVIFIKGPRGPSYLTIMTIEVRWTPHFSLFKFEFIPHLDKFLFEMQNVTVACSTILFNYLIPIKNSYFNDYSLSNISKRTVQVEAMSIFFFHSI